MSVSTPGRRRHFRSAFNRDCKSELPAPPPAALLPFAKDTALLFTASASAGKVAAKVRTAACVVLSVDVAASTAHVKVRWIVRAPRRASYGAYAPARNGALPRLCSGSWVLPRWEPRARAHALRLALCAAARPLPSCRRQATLAQYRLSAHTSRVWRAGHCRA